jgi:hypothetical protein
MAAREGEGGSTLANDDTYPPDPDQRKGEKGERRRVPAVERRVGLAFVDRIARVERRKEGQDTARPPATYLRYPVITYLLCHGTKRASQVGCRGAQRIGWNRRRWIRGLALTSYPILGKIMKKSS